MRTDGKTGGGINVGRLLTAGFQIVLLAGIVGAVAGYALVPSWRDAVNGFVGSVKEVIVPSADQVYTSGPTTGPGTKDHPARLAFDRTLGFWAAPFADGSPPTIEGSFTPPATRDQDPGHFRRRGTSTRRSPGRATSPWSSWMRRARSSPRRAMS